MAKMSGNTADAAVPILKQKFWSKGTTLSGKVTRRFSTQPEPGKTAWCVELALSKLLKVNPEYLSTSEELNGTQALQKIGVAEMTGLMMAINAAGTSHLQEGDIVTIVCTGETATNKGNPRTDFSIDIDRPEGDKKEPF